MNIDDVIERFCSYHPIAIEDREAFQCAIDCMRFARDFIPLGASPHRIKQALNLLDCIECSLGNVEIAERMLEYLSKD